VREKWLVRLTLKGKKPVSRSFCRKGEAEAWAKRAEDAIGLPQESRHQACRSGHDQPQKENPLKQKSLQGPQCCPTVLLQAERFQTHRNKI